MVGEVIVDADAVGGAAQLQAAAGVDERAKGVSRIRRRDANVAGGGNRHQAVVHVVLAHQIPLHLAYALAVQQHFPLRGVGSELFRLPVALLAHQLLLAPAAHRHHLLQIDVVLRQDDLALPRHDTHQVVELLLNRLQIVKDVGVIELKVVEDQRARRVVYELGALIKERAVILVGLNHKERAVAQARGDVEVARHAADHKARLIAAGFEDPGRHARRGGFTVGTGYRQHPAVAQHKVVQPLRAGHIGNALLQHCLNARIAPRHGITNNHQIRGRIELAGVVTLN